MKRKKGKSRNHQQQKQKYFCKRILMRHNILSKKTRLKDIIFQVIFIVISYVAALCYIYAKICS